MLAAGRIATGLGFGLALVVSPIYLSEISPKQMRGRVITVCLVFIVIGSIFSYLFGYLFGHHWKALFAVAAIPATIQAVGMTLLPESPRWLFKQGKIAKGLQEIAKIYNADAPEGRQEMQEEIEQLREIIKEEGALAWATQLKNLCCHYPKALFVGNLLYVIRSFSGSSAVFNYGPTIILNAGFFTQYEGIQRQKQVRSLLK